MIAPHPPIEVLNLRVELTPVSLKWGGTICASFTLLTGPFLVADCRLVRRPDDSFVVSLNMGARRSRVTLQDNSFKAALVAAAVAEFDRKTQHLRGAPAVPARREGHSPLENPSP